MNLAKVPFTYHWILRRAIGGGVKTVLDIGCGEGDLMEVVAKNEKWKITGVDLYKGALKAARKRKVYDNLFNADVSSLSKSKIEGKKFDVVVSSQVIEHLDKNSGKKALASWENFAKKKIIVATTVGYTPFETIGHKGVEKNPYQKHLSGWIIKDFRKMGYRVHGQGLGFLYRENGLARGTPPSFMILWQAISYIFSPVVYCFPQLAFIMVCEKEL